MLIRVYLRCSKNNYPTLYFQSFTTSRFHRLLWAAPAAHDGSSAAIPFFPPFHPLPTTHFTQFLIDPKRLTSQDLALPRYNGRYCQTNLDQAIQMMGEMNREAHD